MAFGLSRFLFVRDLTGFDFGAQPSIDKAQVREIATGRFIANGEAVLLLGLPGVGTTHLAIALGREAIVAGCTVLFTPTMTLVAQLAKAHGEVRLEGRLTHYAKPKPVIIDKLGYLPCEPGAAHLFFQLVSSLPPGRADFDLLRARVLAASATLPPPKVRESPVWMSLDTGRLAVNDGPVPSVPFCRLFHAFARDVLNVDTGHSNAPVAKRLAEVEKLADVLVRAASLKINCQYFPRRRS